MSRTTRTHDVKGPETLPDMEADYRTPSAAALHDLCAGRFSRTLRQLQVERGTSAPGSDEAMDALLDGAIQCLAADVASNQSVLADHGCSGGLSFSKGRSIVEQKPSARLRRFVDVLLQFDALVVCTMHLYLQGLLSERDMDLLLDSHQRRILDLAAGRA